MSNGIATRQNEDNSIAMLAAQRQLYRDAKKYNTVLVALSVWIPFALVQYLFNSSTIFKICATMSL